MGRESQGGTRQPLRLLQHLLQRGRKPVDVGVVHDERRQALEHIERMAGHLAQDVVLAKERADHELREDPRLPRVEEPPGARAARRLAELDRPQQPQAAHLLDHLAGLDERSRASQQQVAQAGATGDQIVRLELREGGKAGGHRHVAGGEGRAVRGGVLERVEDGLVDRRAQQQGADRHIAARQ